MIIRKGFTVKDVTRIGRRIHNLGEEWECFMIDAQNYPYIQYSMGKLDEKGQWGVAELNDTFHAVKDTLEGEATVVNIQKIGSKSALVTEEVKNNENIE